MYSSEEMEKLGEDIANNLLKNASPKTICLCFVGLNLTLAFGIYYLFN